MKPKIQEWNFLKTVNAQISTGNHADYLKEVLKKYEEYKKAFKESFADKKIKNEVYDFRINYLLKKSVWREIEILGKQKFNDLAKKIVASMGWKNDHMHGFEFIGLKEKPDPFYTGSSIAFFAPDWEDDPHPTFKSDEIHIHDLDYIKHPKLLFIFDFGDGHRFTIDLKGTRDLDKKEKVGNFPNLKDQRGIAPEQYPDWEE